MSARLIGVGTGPGDPELLTLKAVRAIAEADVIACFAKAGRQSNARRIVAAHIAPRHIEERLDYPVTTEIVRSEPGYDTAIQGFFDDAAGRIAAHLSAGRTVAVLSEGDPMFYGSYMHLHVRLAPHFAAEIIPGVTAMSGCWSLAGVPIVQGDDVLSVLPGTLDEDALAARAGASEALVVMKIGRNLAKIRRALARAGRLDRAIYVERGTMEEGFAVALRDKPDDVAPYFSIVLVPGWAGLGK